MRFASVYKNFREAQDFQDLLGTLGGRLAGEALLPEEEEAVPVATDEAAATPRRGRPSRKRA